MSRLWRRRASTRGTPPPTWRRSETRAAGSSPQETAPQGGPAPNLEAPRNLDVRLISPEDLDAELGSADLVVDALLGTGFSGEVREKEAGIIEKINSVW